MARLYKIQHRTCGHIGGVGNDRAQGLARLDLLQATGNHGWRLLAIGSEAEAEEALTQVAADEKCDTCRVSAGAPIGQVTGTGVKVEATAKAHRPLDDPGPGVHLWAVTGLWKVTPSEGGRYDLDHENLLTVEGPGCFKCEQTWSPQLAARPCPGAMELLSL